MFVPVGSGFPPILERWLLSFLGGAIPTERRATCGDCAMRKAEGFHDELRFERATKCCTFFPQMAAYQVGGLLLDDDPGMARGKERVRERILEGLNATPFGLGRPAIFLDVYTPDSSFGHAEALRCPYYIDEDGGLCGVWRHREATCSTWFCKHERGKVGFEFWRKLHELLKNVEHSLTVSVAVELGMDRDAMIALENEPFGLNREEDEDYYATMWGPWAGREIEYYEACARVVAPLAWTDVRARCGPVIDEFVARTEQAHKALLSDARAPVLGHLAIHERLGSTGTRIRLRTYSEFDPLDVPTRVAEALHLFMDRPVPIAAADGELDEATVKQLFDFGVLEE